MLLDRAALNLFSRYLQLGDAMAMCALLVLLLRHAVKLINLSRGTVHARSINDLFLAYLSTTIIIVSLKLHFELADLLILD